jgi:hypothetical protein
MVCSLFEETATTTTTASQGGQSQNSKQCKVSKAIQDSQIRGVVTNKVSEERPPAV